MGLDGSGHITYRSVKAIQSKLYQIQARVESEIEFIKQVYNHFDKNNVMAIVQP